MAVKVFFHICAITCSESVVQEIVHSIHFSGLYDEANKIYCYISGEEEMILRVIMILYHSGSKFVIVKSVPNDMSFERLTLEDIHNHVSGEDKILYIHSKGVSAYSMETPNRIACVSDWRYMMLYFLVRHFRTCLEKLDNHDTVGVNYHADKPHWSGNFWWVRGDYFLTLPHTIGLNYLDPEIKFLFLNNPRWYEMYSSGNTDHYEDIHPPFKYVDQQ
jgi:hypothetical protein